MELKEIASLTLEIYGFFYLIDKSFEHYDRDSLKISFSYFALAIVLFLLIL